MSGIVLSIYRLALSFSKKNVRVVAKIIDDFSCKIGLGAQFEKNSGIGYSDLGTLFHDRAIIGAKVTIGGRNNKNKVPLIGDNSPISSGAKIICLTKASKNCIIGANAAVICEILVNCVAVGVPAKIIKRNINDYR